MSNLSAPHFHNEQAAYDYVEARIWPDGATCPKCGERERVSKMGGKSTRMGVYKCYKCRKPFTVKVGTVFESSHVPMHVWLQAIYLICGAKKGLSSNQLHRILGVTLKTAWFMSHRIREAMRSGDMMPLGGGGGDVEVDETFIGRKDGKKGDKIKRAYHHKQAFLSLVDRRSGEARSFVINKVNQGEIAPIMVKNIARETRILTDEARHYRGADLHFAAHKSVSHSVGEYGRGDIHTNTIEGFFSVFKRGMRGVYQQCREKHLHRYLAEFDFRYNNRVALEIGDQERADNALMGIVGKRLTYQTTGA